MKRSNGWRPRVLVCGTGFGRTYLAALRRPGTPFELAGILAQGSNRSRDCARRYQVPLYTEIGQVPGGIDMACVVVNAALNGGPGAVLAQDLMARGIHVLQEHPVAQAELAACLRQARRHGVIYHLNTHYVHVAAVACFIAAAARLRRQQQPLFLDAMTCVQVLYPLADILGQALGSVRPWSLTCPPAAGGRGSEVFRSVSGSIAGVPVTLRIQNQMHPLERDNGWHVMHRVTLAAEGGNLLLANTHGPVLWSPRLHMPADYRDAVTVDESGASYLDLPSATCLSADTAPSYREVIRDDWPRAAEHALIDLRRAITDDDDPLPRGQYHLALCALVADITGQLGRPELLLSAEPAIGQAAELVCGGPAGGQSARNSHFRPAAR